MSARLVTTTLALCAALCGAALSAQQPPNPPGQSSSTQKPDSMTGFIAGTVVDAASGKGVPGVTIMLARRSGQRGAAVAPSRPVVTDSQGRFFFNRLTAATYGFAASKPGWTDVSPMAAQRTVDVGDGDKVTDVKIPLARLATITGAVRDDAGDVVVGSAMMLFRRAQQNGRASWSPTAQASTDDRGVYRFDGLVPGSYLVCVCDRDPVPFDGTVLTTLAAEPIKLMALAARAAKDGSNVASIDNTLRTYAPTFYPSSPTVARAERVTVASGEERASVDITAPMVRALRVSGTVIGADGPLNAAGFTLLASGETDEGAVLTRISPMVVQPDGRFDFVNVPPGNYTLRVMWSPLMPASGPTGAALQFLGSRAPSPGEMGMAMPMPGQPAPTPKVATTAVSVSDRDVTGLTVSLRPGPTITGHIKMANEAPLPAPQEVTRMLLFLAPLDSMTVSQQSTFTQPSPDGTFRITGITPGRYRVTVSNSPSAPSTKSIEVGGVDVADLPLDVTNDLTDVVVTMSPAAMASLRGTVTGTGVAAGLTALLFPPDRKLWAEPVAAVRRFRAAPVSRKGEFTMVSLPVGDYLLAVVPDAQFVDWQDPDKLEALSRTAQRITMAEGERKTVEVKR